MLILIAILGIALIALSFALQRKEIKITDVILWSVTLWIAGYIISTSVLVLLDCFSITKAALCVLGIGGIASAISFNKSSGLKGIRINCNFKKDLPGIIVVILTATLLLMVPYSFYGMGQDEGVYQTEALCYIQGMTDRQFDYEEYYKLSDLGLQDEYINQVQTAPNIAGAYPYADSNNIFGVLTGVDRGCISANSAGFHGLHTLSALMALWGSIFGLANMNGINAILLALCIAWLFKLCRTIKINKFGTSIVILCTLLCPQVLWCAKSSLTEPGLTLIWLVLIYSLAIREKLGIYLSSLMILTYGCYHISLYVFMPLYAFLYIALFFYTADKTYLKGLALSGCAYLYTLWYSLFTACKYMLFNFQPVLKKFINMENVSIFATIAGITLVVIAGVLLFVFRKKNNKNLARVASAMNSSKGASVMTWIIRIVSLLMIAYIAYRFIARKANMDILTYNTIVAFAYLTGITFFILALYQLLIRTSELSRNHVGLVIATTFIYCVIVYSIVFKKDIDYFYYFSRYLTMYIPLIALMAGIAVSHLTSDYRTALGRIKCSVAVVASIIGIYILFPHMKLILNSQDDSRYDWKNITYVNELVADQGIQAAFVRPDLLTAYYYDLKSIGVDVYPITDNFEAAYDEIASWYSGVVIIDGVNPYDYQPDGTCTYTSHAASAGYPVIATLNNTMTEDLGFYRDARTALPNGMYSASYDIVIYRYK